MNLLLKAGQGLQVTGPANLRVINGKLLLLGAVLSSNQEMIIQAGKYFPFDVEKDSEIELLGENFEYSIVNTPLIAPDRKELAQKIEKYPTPLTIMVLGQIDTGKTTVICYLANYLFNSGKKVAVIDLDMGQQDIGPPCTITMGILEKSILRISEIPLSRMIFIGKTSPQGRLVQTLSGARDLLDHALAKSDIVLIDTTGWVSGGAARAFKTAKIRILKPNILVALQKENEIAHLLTPFESSSIQIELLSVYPNIRPRDATTRKFLRESKFNHYFSNATSRLLNLEQIKIENSFFRSGEKLSPAELQFVEQTLECNFFYAEKAADALFLVKNQKATYNRYNLKFVKDYFKIEEIRIVNKNDEKGLIIGLLDKKLNTLGIGLIENILYYENKIRIFTPITEDIYVIQFGFLKLTKTGQELPGPCYFF